MFQGSSSISLDTKGRLAIPAKYRDTLVSECEGKLVMTAHTQNRCALLYPESEWHKKLPEIEALPTFNKSALRAQRLLIGYANSLEMDANGRLLVPATLRDYAGFEKKLMLVGMGKKFELWDEAAWYDTILSQDDNDDLPTEMLSLSL